MNTRGSARFSTVFARACIAVAAVACAGASVRAREIQFDSQRLAGDRESVPHRHREDDSSEPAQDRADVEDTLGRLTSALAALEENARAQDLAWPRRDEDIANEVEPPPAVRALESKARRFRERVAAEARELERAPPEHLDVLLAALDREPSPELLRALLPAIRRCGSSSPAALAALVRLAHAIDPCPRDLVDALAAREEREADEALFALGRVRAEPSLIAASCTARRLASFERVLDLAESRDADDAALGRAALTRLRLSPGPDEALAASLLSRSTRCEDPALRTLLVATLGIVATDRERQPLEELARKEPDLETRVAAIGALGRLGGESAQVLLEANRDARNIAIRRASMHALAAARYRGAIPVLIDQLEDAEFGADALLALERITRERNGNTRGVWLRWWRTQPDSGATDPDLEPATP